jgi:hypothetical protein
MNSQQSIPQIVNAKKIWFFLIFFFLISFGFSSHSLTQSINQSIILLVCGLFIILTGAATLRITKKTSVLKEKATYFCSFGNGQCLLQTESVEEGRPNKKVLQLCGKNKNKTDAEMKMDFGPEVKTNKARDRQTDRQTKAEIYTTVQDGGGRITRGRCGMISSSWLCNVRKASTVSEMKFSFFGTRRRTSSNFS